MYILGNHDYRNEKYQDNYDYPQEWIDESEQIDQWITENEKKIILICQEILKTNLDFFCKGFCSEYNFSTATWQSHVSW